MPVHPTSAFIPAYLYASAFQNLRYATPEMRMDARVWRPPAELHAAAMGEGDTRD
jgi:hypothetical protein